MMEKHLIRAYGMAILTACTMAVNGYDSSVFNSVQGYANFVQVSDASTAHGSWLVL